MRYLQICGIFRDMTGKSNELLIGTVYDCPFTAALFRTDKVHEALPTEFIPVVL